MTDDEVVKVLAEFMGRKIVLAANGSCWWFDDGDDVDYIAVDYLTSYDAIAEVWRKAWTELHPKHLGAAVHIYHSWTNYQPHDHAHALATAISQSKGD